VRVGETVREPVLVLGNRSFPLRDGVWQSERLPDVGGTISQYGRKYPVVSCERMPDSSFALNVAEQETNDRIEPTFA